MILVDTAPLVAIVDPRDALHHTALKHLTALSRAGLWVCEAVVMEACFLLPHRMQRERLRAALGDLNIDRLPTGDPEFWNDVFAWLVKYADHEPDWADGCIAVLCGYHKGLKVWTYDREFQTTWRRADGKAIPLAIK